MNQDLERYRALMAGELSLETLAKLYPNEWEDVQKATLSVVKKDRPELLSEHMHKTRSAIDRWQKTIAGSANPRLAVKAALPDLVKARMSFLALEGFYRTALKYKSGKQVELSPRDERLAEHLFFTRSRSRRSPRLWHFKLVWSLVRAKGNVLSLIQTLGIYCVFSQELGRAITKLAGKKPILEIGAGDGTLTLLLESCGAKVHATDDKSWGQKIRYPDWVEDIDAKSALKKHQPAVVVCSWPPPGNSFEAQVLAHPAVETYVVINSRHRYASGNWDSYEAQRAFAWAKDERLSKLVLPPELDSVVLVFRRKRA